MTTFYLWKSQAGSDMRIDTNPWLGYERAKSCEASEWLEAKKKFGFELTSEQRRLLQTPLAERLERLKKRMAMR